MMTKAILSITSKTGFLGITMMMTGTIPSMTSKSWFFWEYCDDDKSDFNYYQ